ncbi:MAG: quinate 5-dehydrogenase [Truepera sp.]|nr:quinate 5-dehydrogenase [Truepera sp.]MBS3933744.1 quinate 5-dehydrogenase [Truepera sp.]
MKHVVSVSLGSAKRDTKQVITLLGEQLLIERRGTDGDMAAAATLLRELDGKVDAFGLGGMDLFVQVSGRRYYIRDAVRLARNARITPLVCGAGLKETLERSVVELLESRLQWRGKRVLIVAAADRFGMAEALSQAGAKLLLGDLIFALGLPIPIRSVSTLSLVVRLLAPVVLNLPFRWFYPTGSKPERVGRMVGGRFFAEAEVIAGDWHYLRRHAPERLDNKIILTNTTTRDDVAWAQERGVRLLITTTPRYQERSLPTNLLEAAFVALSGKHPLTPTDYRRLIAQAGLAPSVLELNPLPRTIPA